MKASPLFTGLLIQRGKPLVIGLTIVVIAFCLRAYRIGDQELWFDEALSFHIATAADGFAHALRVNDSPPLYYLLLRGWVTVVGTSETALRLLSAFFGTLFVATVIVAGRRFFNRSVGLWSGTVAALSPIHIYYSQEARSYALVTWALLLTYLLFWRAMTQNSWTTWIQAGLAALVALYTHYLALFGLLPALLLLWIWPAREDQDHRGRRCLAVIIICGFLFLPWVGWGFVLMSHPYQMSGFIAGFWKLTPPVLAIPKTLEVFGLGPQAGFFPNLPKVFPGLEFPEALRLTGLAVFFLLAIWVSIPWRDEQMAVPWLAKRKAWLWMLLCFPLAGIWLISFFKPIYLVGRYDMVAYPPYVLLVGLALAKLQSATRKGQVVATLAALLLFVPVALKLSRYYQVSGSTPLAPSGKEAARVLSASASDGDAFAFNLLWGTPTLYYLHRAGFRWENGRCRNDGTGDRFTCRIFPSEDESSFGILRDPLPLDSLARELILSLEGPENFLWVVAEPRHLQDAIFLTELSRMDLQAVPFRVPFAPAIIQFRRR